MRSSIYENKNRLKIKHDYTQFKISPLKIYIAQSICETHGQKKWLKVVLTYFVQTAQAVIFCNG